MKRINEVQIGDLIDSPRNGPGMITGTTKRTITATFQNGNKVKNTYKTSDAYFYPSDF